MSDGILSSSSSALSAEPRSNVILTDSPRLRSKASKVLPMPPLPIHSRISYWLGRFVRVGLSENPNSAVSSGPGARRWGRRNGHWTHVWHAPDIPPQRHRSTFLRCPSLRRFHRLGDPVQLATLAGCLRVVDGDVRGEPAEHAEAERERDDLAFESAEIFCRDDVAVFQLADLAPGPGRGDGRVVASVSFDRLAPVKPRRVASLHCQPAGGLTLEPSQNQRGSAGEEVGQPLGHE